MLYLMLPVPYKIMFFASSDKSFIGSFNEKLLSFATLIITDCVQVWYSNNLFQGKIPPSEIESLGLNIKLSSILFSTPKPSQ